MRKYWSYRFRTAQCILGAPNLYEDLQRQKFSAKLSATVESVPGQRERYPCWTTEWEAVCPSTMSFSFLAEIFFFNQQLVKSITRRSILGHDATEHGTGYFRAQTASINPSRELQRKFDHYKHNDDCSCESTATTRFRGYEVFVSTNCFRNHRK